MTQNYLTQLSHYLTKRSHSARRLVASEQRHPATHLLEARLCNRTKQGSPKAEGWRH
jgi:hypothetical protein